MKKKWVGMVLSVVMAGSLLAGCGSNSETSKTADTGAATEKNAASAETTKSDVTMSISANASDVTVTGFICNQMKELLEESSDMDVKVYINGSLGNDPEVAEQVVSGSVEVLVTNTANLVTMMPELAVFDMPGVFENLDVARASFDDPDFRAAVDQVFESAGFKLLCLSDQGFRQTSSNVALRTLDDFKGLGIRTMENNIHMKYWSALGANPTPMNRAEVFVSLQQGLLEAQEDPYVSIEANKYSEVQKYIVETNHVFSNIVVIMNLDFYNSLSAENQAAVDAACDEILISSRAYCDTSNAEALVKLQEQGMEYIQLEASVVEEIKAIVEAQVYPLVREAAGDELVDVMTAALEKASK